VKRLLFIVLLLLILPACADEGGAEADLGQVVLDYMAAKADGDEDTIRSMICSEMEAQIPMEASSLASVEASLSDDASCETEGTEGDYTMVSCEGAIVAIYGTENREFDLTTYRVVEEDGEWKWCGEG
jgi:hypothetical protein